jgi:hypothetical protein
MSTFKKLDQLDLEIHEVGHEECFIVDKNIAIKNKISTYIN